MPDELFTSHCKMVARAICKGELIPFLGAGINLIGRRSKEPWRHGEDLPSGPELTEHLAKHFPYPKGAPQDLMRVSQFISCLLGPSKLYDELHNVFDHDFPILQVHRFLASLPERLRKKGCWKDSMPLIIITNYDDTLERAFADVSEPYDLVYYKPNGDGTVVFWHRPSDGKSMSVKRGQDYSPNNRSLLGDRAVILKIHGAIARNESRVIDDPYVDDSYVITEDDYIDFMSQDDIRTLLPNPLPARLKRSHYLFLGYSLRDWNMRVFLKRLQNAELLGIRSWAINEHSDEIEDYLWEFRKVKTFKKPLTSYISIISKLINHVPVTGASK